MQASPTTGWLIGLILLSIWELVWKGFALWRASQRDARNWFIAILVINSFGILPIIYLYNTRDPETR